MAIKCTKQPDGTTLCVPVFTTDIEIPEPAPTTTNNDLVYSPPALPYDPTTVSYLTPETLEKIGLDPLEGLEPYFPEGSAAADAFNKLDPDRPPEESSGWYLPPVYPDELPPDVTTAPDAIKYIVTTVEPTDPPMSQDILDLLKTWAASTSNTIKETITEKTTFPDLDFGFPSGEDIGDGLTKAGNYALIGLVLVLGIVYFGKK